MRRCWRTQTAGIDSRPMIVNVSKVDADKVKSCIKAALVQFFNFLVRLLFKCGCFLKAAYMQNPESAKPVKAVWQM